MSSPPQHRELATAADPAAESAPPTDVEVPVEILPDTVVADRYRIIRRLGAGAMGTVFLAEHVMMRKRFALKVLLPRAMASKELVARFEREAIAAGKIQHPSVCGASDFGRLPDGSFFLVLEFVDGRSLRSIVSDGPLTPTRALGIARQVLDALGAAHAAGVVHRDIKPENVMIVPGSSGGDIVKVLDFGIAKVDAAALGQQVATNLTRLGVVYGTPTYMSPEQAIGETIDHRADLYSVGVMLHEMITGEPPFSGEGMIILAQHVNAAPPPLVSPHGPVSPALAAFVARLLAKKQSDRPDSAAAALAELDKIQPVSPVVAGREAFVTSPGAGAPAPRRSRLVAVLGVAALLVIVVAGFALRRAFSPAEDEASVRKPSTVSKKPSAPEDEAPKKKKPANSTTDGSKGLNGKVEATF